jgi:hypothetical protein
LNYIRPENIETTLEYDIWSQLYTQQVRTHDGKQLGKDSYKKFKSKNTNFKDNFGLSLRNIW